MTGTRWSELEDRGSPIDKNKMNLGLFKFDKVFGSEFVYTKGSTELMLFVSAFKQDGTKFYRDFNFGSLGYKMFASAYYEIKTESRTLNEFFN